jgi:cell wall-associated NlpC family hydrolase
MTINGKEFTVTLNIVKVGLKSSLLLATKKTAQLKTTGIKTGVKWSSTNPKVVKVSSGGKVTAKKNGNAVIKAVLSTDQGEFTLGCAVSVVTQKRYKAIKKAIRIVKTSTYSQPKRMQNGYYDCSSLVWRAYKYAGISLMSSSYAPVAAELGKWIVQKKKKVKGGLSESNVQGMKLHAGDLMFETGLNNGRYKGIYHVEMITGYTCIGFGSDGKPELLLTWASRPDGAYGYSDSYLVGRP